MKDKLRSGFNDDPSSSTSDEPSPSIGIYVSIGFSVVLILIIAFLLFCLLSKRDLAPCPRRSDFGRRYTQIRKRLSRSFTIGGGG